MSKSKGGLYSVIRTPHGKFWVVQVLSEHELFDEAYHEMMKIVAEEGGQELQAQIVDLRQQGIPAGNAEDEMKEMTPEQRQAFEREQFEKYIKPLIELHFAPRTIIQ